MNLTITQQELLSYVQTHPGLRASEIHEDMRSLRDLSVIDVHEELGKIQSKGLVQECHEVNEGYVWWPVEVLKRA